MNESEKIIDIHHHIIPPLYKKSLKKIGITMSGGYPIKDWTPQDSLDMMDKLHIDIAVTSISEPATLPFSRKQASKVARAVNEYQAELKQQYPDKFKSFALIPLPFVKESIKEIKYALDVLKLDGVGLLSNYNESFLGDDCFDDVMRVINDRKGIVFVHPSSSPKQFKKPQYVFADFLEEFTFNTTRAATNLILSGTVERYSNIKFILAHSGGTLPYINWRISEAVNTEKYIMEAPAQRLKSFITSSKKEIVKSILQHPIQYGHLFKTYKHALSGWSSLTKSANYYIGQFYYDTALSTGESTFASLKEVTDISHILFGSDAHYAPDSWIAKMQKNISESHYFSEQDKVNIFNVNSSRIL